MNEHEDMPSQPQRGGRRVTVVTSHVYPPIPIRYMDWQATLDGYEPGDLIGNGSTEAEAVMDLYQQIEDRESDQEEQAEERARR
jgi:hypothetical protein